MSNEFNITRDALESLTLSAGGDAYFGYSGRGMYGATCVGITLPNLTDFVSLGAAIKTMYDNDEIDSEMYREMLTGASTDSMGHDCIIYWHNIGCDDAPSDEDEEDEA